MTRDRESGLHRAGHLPAIVAKTRLTSEMAGGKELAELPHELER